MSNISAYQLPHLPDLMLEGLFSKSDIAKVLYPGHTCDSALPQGWVNYAAAYCVDVRPGWVVLYRQNWLGCYLMPLYQEALMDLSQSDSPDLQRVAKLARETLGDFKEEQICGVGG